MPKCNKILMDRKSDAVSLIRQISKQHLKFNHAYNHINERLTLIWQMILSQDTKEDFTAMFKFLFSPIESQHLKQLKQNVAIIMQNKHLEQSLIGKMPFQPI